jgi:hypothetical protein
MAARSSGPFRPDGLLVLVVESSISWTASSVSSCSAMVGDGRGGQGLDHVFADVIVQFGDHFAGHQVGDRGGKSRRSSEVEQFEQVGDVGRVERLDQIIGPRLVARCQASRARR